MVLVAPKALRSGTNYSIKKKQPITVTAKKTVKKVPKKAPAPVAKKKVGFPVVTKRQQARTEIPKVPGGIVGGVGRRIIKRATKRALASKRTGREVFKIGGRKVVTRQGPGGRVRKVVVRGNNRTIVRRRGPGGVKTVVRTGGATKRTGDDTTTVMRRNKKGASYRKTVTTKKGGTRTVRVSRKKATPGRVKVVVTRRGKGGKVRARHVKVIGKKITRARSKYPTKYAPGKKTPPRPTEPGILHPRGKGKRLAFKKKRRKGGPRNNLSMTVSQLKNVSARKYEN